MSDVIKNDIATDPSETVATALGPYLGAASGTIAIVGLFGGWADDRRLWILFLIGFMGVAGAVLHPKWVALKKTPDWLAAASAAVYLPPTVVIVLITGDIESPYWLLFLVGTVSSGFSGKGIAAKYIAFGTFVALATMIGPSLAQGNLDQRILTLSTMRVIAILMIGFVAYRSVIEIESILVKRAESERFKLLQKQQLMEAELRTELVEKQSGTLRLAHEKLARAARLKDEFLANMSHELRTPLNSILGVSEALTEHVYGPINESQRESIQTIERSGHHLLELINNLLDLSKIDAGKFVLDQEEVLVGELIAAAVQLMRVTAAQRQLTLEVSPVDSRIRLRCDGLRVRQVLINLLANAMKFTPAGGTVGVEVRLRDSENEIELIVWDTGIGIAKDQQDLLFDAFVQLKSGLSREYDGTGLGLTLVSRIVKLHGGRVELESELDQGSRFTVVLPNASISEMSVDTSSDSSPTETDSSNEEPSPLLSEAESERPLILLVEDNPANIMHVRDYLHSLSYRIEVASNGVEGLEKIRSIRPSLVLLDMQMPQMNGFEVLEQFREDGQIADIPVIAVTALAMLEDKQRCLAAGASAYLSKPFRLTELIKLIRELLPDCQEVDD